MDNYEKRLEELSAIFSSALKIFNEKTTLNGLRVLEGENYLADEMQKSEMVA